MSRMPTYLTNPQPIKGFTDAEMYDQIDVSDENSRTYVFGADKAYRIDLPLIVAVKKSGAGHSHRVIDSTGQCHYIPKGWIAIYWTLRADTAIPLPDLSEQMGAAQEVTTEDLEKARDYLAGQDEVIMPPPSEAQDAEEREGIIDSDDLADSILTSIDEAEIDPPGLPRPAYLRDTLAEEVPTSREVEEHEHKEDDPRTGRGA